MTRFGVPDDDMPDSLPPPGWGPAPFDDRDLDAVLAGYTADVPDALLPVAEVLVALRAAPAPGELRGEANIMAEFRALGLGGAPARPVKQAPAQPLLVVPGGLSSPRRPVRHRGRRRAASPVSRWAGVLTGVAAAAAIVIVVAFTGNLPGPIDRLAHLNHPATTRPSASTAADSASPNVGKPSGAGHPTTDAPATHSTGSARPESGSTCRAFYGDFKYPDRSSRTGEMSLWRRLTQLAGSENPQQVYNYCAPYVTGLFPHWTPALGQYPAYTGNGPGNQGDDVPGTQNSPGTHDGPATQNGTAGGEQGGSGGGFQNGSGGGFSR